MKSVLVATSIAALLGAPLVHRDQASANVAGLWLGEARSRGGLGNWIELRPDGTAQFIFGAMVDGTYRMEGTSLWMTTVGQPHELPAVPIRIEGDTAVLQQPPPADAPPRETLSADDRAMLDRMSQPITMTREGNASPGTPPLVGTWTYTHPTGGIAHQTFTRDGKMFLLVPMQTTGGTYTASPGQVEVKLPGGNQTLVLKGDLLISGSLDGKHSTFRRAPK